MNPINSLPPAAPGTKVFVLEQRTSDGGMEVLAVHADPHALMKSLDEDGEGNPPLTWVEPNDADKLMWAGMDQFEEIQFFITVFEVKP